MLLADPTFPAIISRTYHTQNANTANIVRNLNIFKIIVIVSLAIFDIVNTFVIPKLFMIFNIVQLIAQIFPHHQFSKIFWQFLQCSRYFRYFDFS